MALFFALLIVLFTGCSQSYDIPGKMALEQTKEAAEDRAVSVLSRDDFLVSVAELSIPDYSGTDFYIVNDNVPFFNDKLMSCDGENFIFLSELDGLGRCGTCIGLFSNSTLPTEERGEIGHIKPTGWQTVKYDKSVIPDMYLYNRCHLLMYAVSGINDDVRNLITGTRQFNLSMLEIENQVYDLLKNDTKVRLLYRVTPLFEGDNLVAKGVLMEAAALGPEYDFKLCIFIYNVQDGIDIDYATGNSELAGTEEPAGELIEEPAKGQVDTDSWYSVWTSETNVIYVANTNTMKFHYPDCSSVEKIAPGNRWDYTGSREELINMGYEPCKRCNP